MKRIVGIIFLSLLFACSRQETSADREQEQEIEQSESVLLVFDYLKHQVSKNKISINSNDLKLITETTDHLGITHIKFQQVFQSVPVWNKELFAHINKQKKVFRVDQNVVVIPKKLNVQPKLPIKEIASYALKTMDKKASWQVKKPKLIIYINSDGTATLAYHVELEGGLLTEFVVLNAKNGDLLHRITGTYTQE